MQGTKMFGYKELRRYEDGLKLSHNQAIKAKCNECMGGFIDGRIDCGISECPLYPFMKYGVAWKTRSKVPQPHHLVKLRKEKIKPIPRQGVET